MMKRTLAYAVPFAISTLLPRRVVFAIVEEGAAAVDLLFKTLLIVLQVVDEKSKTQPIQKRVDKLENSIAFLKRFLLGLSSPETQSKLAGFPKQNLKLEALQGKAKLLMADLKERVQQLRKEMQQESSTYSYLGRSLFLFAKTIFLRTFSILMETAATFQAIMRRIRHALWLKMQKLSLFATEFAPLAWRLFAERMGTFFKDLATSKAVQAYPY